MAGTCGAGGAGRSGAGTRATVGGGAAASAGGTASGAVLDPASIFVSSFLCGPGFVFIALLTLVVPFLLCRRKRPEEKWKSYPIVKCLLQKNI